VVVNGVNIREAYMLNQVYRRELYQSVNVPMSYQQPLRVKSQVRIFADDCLKNIIQTDTKYFRSYQTQRRSSLLSRTLGLNLGHIQDTRYKKLYFKSVYILQKTLANKLFTDNNI
jgi:hypothetical protein